MIVAALRAMQAAGTLKKANITVFLTGDEEDAGRPLCDLAPRPRRRGKEGRRRARLRGPRGRRTVQRHGLDRAAKRRQLDADASPAGAPIRPASAPGDYGAIYELARIIDQFRRELPEDKLTYNVGLVGGGQTATLDAGKIRLEATGKTNIIAATAVARGDLRAISQDQIDRTEAKMRAIVAQPLAGAHAEISFDADIYPPMPPTEGNRAILAELNGGQSRHGLAADGRARRRRSAAPATSASLPPKSSGLAGLGPASSGSHTATEAVDIPVDLQAGEARRNPDEPARDGAPLSSCHSDGRTAVRSCNRRATCGLCVSRAVRCAASCKESMLWRGSRSDG